MGEVISEALLARTPIDELRFFSSGALERLGRLTFPIMATPGDAHFRRIGWDEALERTLAAFAASAPGRTFFYASGRSSNEAAFLLGLLARAYGTRTSTTAPSTATRPRASRSRTRSARGRRPCRWTTSRRRIWRWWQGRTPRATTHD